MKHVAPDTLWRKTAGMKPAFPRQTGAMKADVAIVGGGIAGLSSALTLASRGRKIVLVEAEEIGFGASGRNAGFVVPNFSKAAPSAVCTRLGARKGQKLLELVSAGGERVFDLATQMGLGRQAEQNGWLQPAHSLEMAEDLQRQVAHWQRLGRPVEWLNAAETGRRTGMSIYHGALCDRSGGMINPLAYVHGLARLADEAGATIFEKSPVRALSENGDGWTLQCAGGAISASTVILCTNAETGGVASMLGRGVVPLTVFQIATAPLPDDVVRSFSPRREPVSDTRSNIFTFRLDADNRLISGGMAVKPLAGEAGMGELILDRLVGELGLSVRPRLEHVWRGTAAVTRDFLPHIYRFAPGLFGVIGCNGRGVAMTTMLGGVLADAVAGVPDEQLAVPFAATTRIPFRNFASLAASVYLAKGMWDDRRTTRRMGPQGLVTTTSQEGELK